jgi:DNA replication and repair protein RecF
MITKLNLKQFRNHKLLELPINSKLVAITGPNASGKTNILESIYVSSLTKSFRSSDAKLITHNKDFFTIDRYDDDILTHLRYSIQNGNSSKKVRYKNQYQPIKNIIGKNPTVLFEPNDLDLLVGLPTVRRKYLDQLLSQIDQKYLINLQKYKKLLTSKNSLLRRAKKQSIGNLSELLFVLNIQIVEPAIYII